MFLMGIKEEEMKFGFVYSRVLHNFVRTKHYVCFYYRRQFSGFFLPRKRKPLCGFGSKVME